MDAIDPKYDSMTDFELVDELSKLGNVKVPNAIEEIRDAKILHNTVCDVDQMENTVKKMLGVQYQYNVTFDPFKHIIVICLIYNYI